MDIIEREKLLLVTPGLWGYALAKTLRPLVRPESLFARLFSPPRARLAKLKSAMDKSAQARGETLVAMKVSARFKSSRREEILHDVRTELVGLVARQFVSARPEIPEPEDLLIRTLTTIVAVEEAWDRSGISVTEGVNEPQLGRLLAAYMDVVCPDDMSRGMSGATALLHLVRWGRDNYGRYFFVEDTDLAPEDFVGFRESPTEIPEGTAGARRGTPGAPRAV